MIELHHGDCLEVMKAIPDGSVDLVLCDLPYGTTACKWDSVIPFDALWEQYKRVAKLNAAIVLTAAQPFTTALIASNMEMYRYSWVWNKSRSSNPYLAKQQPLRITEDVAIFYRKLPTYNPQLRDREKKHLRYSKTMTSATNSQTYAANATPYEFNSKRAIPVEKGYPQNIIDIPTLGTNGGKRQHPTQKPVALMEYLIRTYSNEGDTVLDNCMGSGTTGVACQSTARRFIGIEKDAEYFAIAQQRIEPDRYVVPVSCTYRADTII